MYDPEQCSVVKGFTQELDCTFAHGNNPHLCVPMRSDEDDWYSRSVGLKLRLQFRPDMPGIRISAMSQAALLRASESRNCSAELKHSADRPSDSIKSCSAR
jgi:hypothetical protein